MPWWVVVLRCVALGLAGILLAHQIGTLLWDDDEDDDDGGGRPLLARLPGT
jgi:hypothetical protein